MKVLIVLGNGRSDDTLGDHAVPINLANELVKLGVDVTILANSNDNHTVDPDIEVIQFSGSSRGWAKDLISKSREVYYKGNFDHVNYHFSAFAVAKWISLLEDDMKMSYVNHSSVMGGISTVYIVDDLARLNTKSNFRLVFISDFMEERWKQITGFPEDETIPNGVRINNGVVYPDRSKIVPIDDRNGKLIHVGRIDKVKNTKDIISFVDRFKIPTIIIGQPQRRFTGNQDYADECMRLIEESPNIEHYLFMSNDEVRSYLSKSVASISMSQSECKCLALLESLSVGTPILSSACKDNFDTITVDDTFPNGKNGIYTDTLRKRQSKKQDMLYESWLDLKNNPRDPYEIYDETKKYYDVSVMAKNYLAMMESMV